MGLCQRGSPHVVATMVDDQGLHECGLESLSLVELSDMLIMLAAKLRHCEASFQR